MDAVSVPHRVVGRLGEAVQRNAGLELEFEIDGRIVLEQTVGHVGTEPIDTNIEPEAKDLIEGRDTTSGLSQFQIRLGRGELWRYHSPSAARSAGPRRSTPSCSAEATVGSPTDRKR
ncbi:MAG: hypothetical protein R2710_27785 [Acidimicrobiales bacterium]